MKKNKEIIEKVENYLIDEMGHYLDAIGAKPLLGRIWGFLMVNERPVSMKELSKRLKVSKAALSTNLNAALMLNLLKKVYMPEYPRENFYVLKSDYMESILEPGIKKLDLFLERVGKAVDMFDENSDELDDIEIKTAYKRVKLIRDSLQIMKDEYYDFADRVQNKIRVLKNGMEVES